MQHVLEVWEAINHTCHRIVKHFSLNTVEMLPPLRDVLLKWSRFRVCGFQECAFTLMSAHMSSIRLCWSTARTMWMKYSLVEVSKNRNIFWLSFLFSRTTSSVFCPLKMSVQWQTYQTLHAGFLKPEHENVLFNIVLCLFMQKCAHPYNFFTFF